MHSPGVCIYCCKPDCQHYFITGKNYVIFFFFLKLTFHLPCLWRWQSVSGEWETNSLKRYIRSFLPKHGKQLPSWASPDYQSHYQHSKASTNSCLASIVLHLLFKDSTLGSYKVRPLTEKQRANLNTYERNILTSKKIIRSVRAPWASEYDVGGYSIRLFVWMLQRMSHVLGWFVFGGAVGSLQPGWGCRILQGREEAATSQWIIFSWLCSKASRATLIYPNCQQRDWVYDTVIARNHQMAAWSVWWSITNSSFCSVFLSNWSKKCLWGTNIFKRSETNSHFAGLHFHEELFLGFELSIIKTF